MKLFNLLAFILSFFVLQTAMAQYVPEEADSSSTDRFVLVTLKSGEQFSGNIQSETDAKIVLKTKKFGILTLYWKDILSVKDIKPEDLTKEGMYFEDNLQSTRYFFGPNGLGLKQGEGYYQNVWIFFNQVSYGFTDNFSLSAGTVPLFLFAGAPTPVWIVPKVSIPIKKDVLSVGAGGLFGTVIGLEESTFGIAFGTFTVGNKNHNASLSVGYGMLQGDWSSAPVVTFSGMTRVSKKTYLITENYFFPAESTLTLLSFGARSFAGKVGIDYGLFIPIGADVFLALPWLGLTVPFGNY